MLSWPRRSWNAEGESFLAVQPSSGERGCSGLGESRHVCRSVLCCLSLGLGFLVPGWCADYGLFTCAWDLIRG
jgi:hypothetical protein